MQHFTAFHRWSFVHSVALALFRLNQDMLLQETTLDRLAPLVSRLGDSVATPEQLIAVALANRVKGKRRNKRK